MLSDRAFDRDWIAHALGCKPGSIASIEWSAIGTGQVAASYRGAIAWESGEGPASLVVKAPSDNPASRAAGHSLSLYAREVHWYQSLRFQCAVHCPHSFASDIDEETSDFRLLLEDCAQARQGDQLAGAGSDQVAAAIDELALLHGAFWNSPALASHPLTQRDEEASTRNTALYAQCWPAFAERYADRLDAEALSVGERLAESIDKLMERENETFTLGHGDFRLDNLLFPDDGGRVYVLDWQTIAQQSPAIDLSYLIGTSFADAAQRKAQEEPMLARYFEGLRAQATVFDEAELRAEYKVRALTGVVMAVMSSMLVQRTERGDEMFATMYERPAWHALECDSVALL